MLGRPDLGYSAGWAGNPMKLLHVALVRSSEAASNRFFQDVLGLARTRTKTASAELCAQLFGREREHQLVYYGNEHLLFEVFVSDRGDFGETGHLGHVCLEVDDARELLARCVAAGIEVRQAVQGGSSVIFIADEDGNLFEIKGRA
jgi:catechol 2,3-dioxygenase-like lactoylglutathione lyase family enzyme